jgi:hypothetical protein
MAQQASWRAEGRSKPGKNKSHHNTPRRHQQHVKKIKNAVKYLKNRPQPGGFLMVRYGLEWGYSDLTIDSDLIYLSWRLCSVSGIAFCLL